MSFEGKINNFNKNLLRFVGFSHGRTRSQKEGILRNQFPVPSNFFSVFAYYCTTLPKLFFDYFLSLKENPIVP